MCIVGLVHYNGVTLSAMPKIANQKPLRPELSLVRKKTPSFSNAADLWKHNDLSGAVLRSLAGNYAVVDRQGFIIAVNLAWERFARENADQAMRRLGVGTNYLEILRRAMSSGCDSIPQVVSGLEKVLQGSQESFSLEYSSDFPTEQRWFRMDVVPLERKEGGAVISHVDITDQKRAQLELQENRSDLEHVQRASTLGELAASLAHELNQPLGAILSNAQAARRFLGQTEPNLAELTHILTDIISDDKRASEVIRRMRALMKKTSLDRKHLHLNDIVNDVRDLLHSDALIRGAIVTLELAPNLPLICGDVIQLQQVLLNIVLNGFDAMRSTPADLRVLGITTCQPDPDTVKVSISDAGHGLKKEDQERIFEPFFTTKKEGLGMGLMIARSIMQAHQGRIWAEPNAEKGTTFHVTIPPASYIKDCAKECV